MNSALQELSEYITGTLSQEVVETKIGSDELIVVVRREVIVKVMTFLRDDVNCQFKQLMDVCGVDYPGRENRFEVVYNLLSLTHNMRLRIKVNTDADTPVPSVTGVFSSANWWEREVWDLFGVYFSDHPDLRRIMTDYGFKGHPLRKDFPLSGYLEVRYDDELKRVVYEPVKLTQEFRGYDFLSPWEGLPPLPSASPEDDKAKDQG